MSTTERRYLVMVWAVRAMLLVAALCLLNDANAQNTATISFVRPSTYADGSALPSTVTVTYRLYQGLKGQPRTLAGDITGTSQTVTTGLQGGSEYCWHVTAVANGIESAASNEGCKAFPFAAPGAVVITVK